MPVSRDLRDIQNAACELCALASRVSICISSLSSRTAGKRKRDTHDEVCAEDRQDHRRELPLPVGVVVVLHGEEERREPRPECADGDEDLRGDAGGEDGNECLEAVDEVSDVCSCERTSARTFRTKPVTLLGRKRTVARTGSRRM